MNEKRLSEIESRSDVLYERAQIPENVRGWIEELLVEVRKLQAKVKGLEEQIEDERLEHRANADRD